MSDEFEKTTTRLAILALALVAAAGLGACEGGAFGSDSGSTLAGPDGQASLTVRMTDAPGDLAAAWIRVTEIRLAGETEAEGEENSGGTTLPVDDPSALIPLTPEDITDLVEGEPIEAGTYGQLRLVIDGGVAESTGGQVYTFGGAEHPDGLEADGTLKCPSCTQTGVKVNLPEGGLEVADGTTIVMLDFNVSESFGHTAGRSGKFILRPTITSSVVETSGGIEGTVVVGEGVEIPECGGAERSVVDFTPRAVLASDTETTQTATVEATNDAGTEGSYSMDFLQAGDWNMEFVAEKEFELDGGGTETLAFEAEVDPAQVTVTSGGTATADYTITSAECTGDGDGGDGGDGGSQ